MTTDVEGPSTLDPPAQTLEDVGLSALIADLASAIERLSAASSLDELAIAATTCGANLAEASGAAAVIWSDGRRAVAAAVDGERWGYPEVLDRAIQSALAEGRDGDSLSAGATASDSSASAGAGARVHGAPRPRLSISGFRGSDARPVLAAVPLRAPGGDRGVLVVLAGDDSGRLDPDRRAALVALGAAAGGLVAHLPSTARHGPARVGSEAAVLEHDARAERQRIARELHDGLIQSLYGTGLAIRARASRTDIPERGRRTMQGWVERIDNLVDEARAYVDELEAADDAVAELGTGLDVIADEAAAAGLDVYTEVTATEHVRPTPDVRREILKVAHEAVSNVVRHAEAHRIILRVEMDPATDDIQLTVEDDGVGFDPAAGLPAGHGLRNMAARASALGGGLDVVSRPSAGTKVRLRVRLSGRAGSSR